jgi:uncharacterized protein (DUF1330 family)
MAAYVIVDIEVTDPALYEEYKKVSPQAIAAYGGKYLARGGKTTMLEGDWSPKRLVILEFPNAKRAQEWWDSTEYAQPKTMRQRSTRTNMLILEGILPG